jgi:microcin C transport system substrate-binding protein
VDAAQYEYRTKQFDFDMVIGLFAQSASPGNEQIDFWASVSADTPGSRNWAGVRDPVVDKLIERLIASPDRAALVARTRALDRVLLWGHYVIPHYYIAAFRVVYWNRFGRPAVTPQYDLGFDSWWIDPGKPEPRR